MLNTITITVEIYPEKLEEFIQVVRSVNDHLKSEKSITRCVLYQDTSDSNHFHLIQEMATRDHLDSYVDSNNFRVLIGALKLLTRHTKIEYNLVADAMGKMVPISG